MDIHFLPIYTNTKVITPYHKVYAVKLKVLSLFICKLVGGV